MVETEAAAKVGRGQPGKVRSQTVDRAALVLTCFSAGDPHLTLAQIAARLELNQSTVYRYVATLHAVGLLERDERRGGYRLGLRVVELAGVVLNQLAARREALPEMDRLRDDLGFLVNLAVLDGADVVHVAHSAPQGWPVWVTTPGRRAVAHCTALGKVLLAHRPWDEVRRVIEAAGWRPYTDRSIQDFDRLRAELDAVRANGFALDDGERGEGSLCVGAPVRDHSGLVVAALSVSSSTRRLDDGAREELPRRVVDAAARVSSRLGFATTVGFA
jgi:IclR family acetate operon transcriptional repressor